MTVEEMFHFWGIVLKMSIENHQLRWINAYFCQSIEIFSKPGGSTKISDFSSQSLDNITENHFQQIRAALHTESGISSVGDKCHQLRVVIKSSNKHAKTGFMLTHECLFDEGGIASKLRHNPVCQYNSSKPDKYRINSLCLQTQPRVKILIISLMYTKVRMQPMHTLLRKHGTFQPHKKLQ